MTTCPRGCSCSEDAVNIADQVNDLWENEK